MFRARAVLSGGISLALACAFMAPTANAQIAFGADTAAAHPLALSISGGISLGSYQAGVNFGLLELYRHAAWNPEFRQTTGIPLYRLRSVTGASAGNINTLLWAIEACTDLRTEGDPYRSPDPEESLFWDVWGDIGWNRIFARHSPELALFDRAGLIENLLTPKVARRMSDPRLVDACLVRAGITLTRVDPATLPMQDLAIPTQRLVTVFNVIVDRDGAVGDTLVRFTRVSDVSDEDHRFGALAHLGPEGGEIQFGHLLSAIKASAAFPVAFAPVDLDTWQAGDSTGSPSMFLDGGVFDNNPVGLARSLYELTADERDLDVLYVNPYRYRGELMASRADPARPVTPGGIAGVMRFLEGAVPTARQYELQLLARERALLMREHALHQRADSLRAEAEGTTESPLDHPGVEMRLLLSSRAYPVFGEHLGAFAAFLARPAREFDFNVGVYDAIYMALWEHKCTQHVGDLEARHACVGDRMGGLIEDPDLVRDPARQVLRLLHAREYGGRPVLAAPASAGLRDRMTVQAAMFRAMGTQFEPVDRKAECTDPRLISQILCGDGLQAVLDTLRNDREAFGIIRRWAGECGDLTCNAEPVFRDLVASPKVGGTRLLDDVFDRLRYVERMVRRDSTVPGSDYLRLVTGVQWVFHASHLRSRQPFTPTPTSAPPGSWASQVPVSYVGANLGTPGVEVRWQPMMSLGHPWVARGAVIYHYNALPILSEDHHYVGFGGGVGRDFAWIFISEAGIEAHHFRATSDFAAGARSASELELYAILLAGQVRVSGRLLPAGDQRGRLHGGQGWTLSAGLSDPMGLGFWAYRLMRGG